MNYMGRKISHVGVGTSITDRRHRGTPGSTAPEPRAEPVTEPRISRQFNRPAKVRRA